MTSEIIASALLKLVKPHPDSLDRVRLFCNFVFASYADILF